jgi:hypothetical protein
MVTVMNIKGLKTIKLYQINKYIRNGCWVFLGGLLVSVLAIRPKVTGFKLARGRRILKGHKIRSTTSFGMEVQPSVPCRSNFRRVTGPYRVKTDTSY